ncbi:DUF1501 domain-containing protein [Methylobrevis pamukkalensis]|uniref:DUF1501 domain-containing protein n=1 Tax=Methylobrevis pamukkalensis TaxID=1439726 RepID=A0A1E3H0Z0_9HYPH|nr:DUF1501 domain-containing protein [Methylobrevis pamukkalensis]ODN69962.1 hypothetical protein A6302_02735 [Methylobrevis pamukkalensis]
MRAARPFADLDDGLASLRAALGPVWRDTVVVIATEFGRSLARNRAGGTDHGHGSAMLLAGGALRGGRVVADWPGLAPEPNGGGLLATLDRRAVLKGLLRDHFGIDDGWLDTVIFPDSRAIRALDGIMA